MLRAEREALSCMECNASQSIPHPNFALRMLFKAAQRDELLIQNPAEFVNTLRQRSISDKGPFTLAEIQAGLSIADPKWQSLIYG